MAPLLAPSRIQYQKVWVGEVCRLLRTDFNAAALARLLAERGRDAGDAGRRPSKNLGTSLSEVRAGAPFPFSATSSRVYHLMSELHVQLQARNKFGIEIFHAQLK